ncbi:MAG TPA: hypothetical protein VI583_17240 [Cyclobacteriaceae bacterium]|nr:hypothetical protein [Cyclobacteriaceae bacterium]
MKTSKILLGGIAGGVAFFLLGWLIYGILLMDYSAANYNQCAMRPEEGMVWWALIISNLGYGFLFATVFGWSNIRGIAGGAKAGGIIGILVILSIDLGMYSMTTTFSRFSAVILDIFVYTVMSTIVGAVVALAMGKKEG